MSVGSLPGFSGPRPVPADASRSRPARRREGPPGRDSPRVRLPVTCRTHAHASSDRRRGRAGRGPHGVGVSEHRSRVGMDGGRTGRRRPDRGGDGRDRPRLRDPHQALATAAGPDRTGRIRVGGPRHGHRIRDVDHRSAPGRGGAALSALAPRAARHERRAGHDRGGAPAGHARGDSSLRPVSAGVQRRPAPHGRARPRGPQGRGADGGRRRGDGAGAGLRRRAPPRVGDRVREGGGTAGAARSGGRREPLHHPLQRRARRRPRSGAAAAGGLVVAGDVGPGGNRRLVGLSGVRDRPAGEQRSAADGADGSRRRGADPGRGRRVPRGGPGGADGGLRGAGGGCGRRGSGAARRDVRAGDGRRAGVDGARRHLVAGDGESDPFAAAPG